MNEEAAKQSWQLGALMLKIRAIFVESPPKYIGETPPEYTSFPEYASLAVCFHGFDQIPVVFNDVCRNFLDTAAVKPGLLLPNFGSLYKKFKRVLHVVQSANTIVKKKKKMGACRTLYARDTVHNLRWALEIVLEFLEKKEIKLILKEIKKIKKIYRMRFRAKGRFSTYFRLGEIVRLFVRERQQLRKNFNKLNTYLAKIDQEWKIKLKK